MQLPKGFRFGAVEAAVKKPGRLDVGLLWSDAEASVAGVFTRNKVVAAPVLLCRERIKGGRGRGVLINASNANACTGERGMEDARTLTAEVAKLMGASADEVFMCSTGVIGAYLPVAKISAALGPLTGALEVSIEAFSRSIMTTDTVPKATSRTVETSTGTVTIAGTVKGAGMIRPDMATMLGFIATDARVGHELLGLALREAVDYTFNSITIDGDTSTNDTVLIFANGAAGTEALESSPRDLELFRAALKSLCAELARAIVKDGEGVTKLVDITVRGAASDEAARKAAFTIAESPLVKTALNGEDPNWGRIAGALGRSGGYEAGPFHISIGGVEIVRSSSWLGEEAEASAHRVMTGDEYEIVVTIEEGEGTATVTTSDFSADYVRINADYRS